MHRLLWCKFIRSLHIGVIGLARPETLTQLLEGQVTKTRGEPVELGRDFKSTGNAILACLDHTIFSTTYVEPFASLMNAFFYIGVVEADIGVRFHIWPLRGSRNMTFDDGVLSLVKIGVNVQVTSSSHAYKC